MIPRNDVDEFLMQEIFDRLKELEHKIKELERQVDRLKRESYSVITWRDVP